MAYNRRNMTISYPPTMRTIINKETSKIKTEFERIDAAKIETTAAPQNIQSSAYTLVATDHGKHIYTTANVTVPSGVFTAGQSITIVNNSTSNITLVQGSGLTLRQAGQTTIGDRTIQNYGLVTVFFVSSTEAYASGFGLA